MIEGLPQLLEDSGQPGLTELRGLVRKVLNGAGATGQVIEQQRLNPRVYRLRFDIDSRVHSLIAKRLEPRIARRIELVMSRWLPALGLDQGGPPLLGVVAGRSGQCVWHIYEDLGDWALNTVDPDPACTQVVVELLAQIHTRFAEHPLLAECRLHGGDLGVYFYSSNVRDAINALEALRPPEIEMSAKRLGVRDRLLERMCRLLDEQPERTQMMIEFGGPETLLHGDLWTTNTFVIPVADGLRARLIDWDHAAVGPACYDLSTFLLRFPIRHRPWILDHYRECVARSGWRLPVTRYLNVLFDTAERARYANRVIWPALALLTDRSEWGFDALAEVEQWFEALQPVLPE